jgi:hypothetical protein
MSLVVACDDEDGASLRDGRIPTPVGSVNRMSCDTIASTDYFLNDDERAWFTQNCNRLSCNAIRGTAYVSTMERTWYLANCP